MLAACVGINLEAPLSAPPPHRPAGTAAESRCTLSAFPIRALFIVVFTIPLHFPANCHTPSIPSQLLQHVSGTVQRAVYCPVLSERETFQKTQGTIEICLSEPLSRL